MFNETVLHLSDIHFGVNFVLRKKDTLGLFGQSPEEYLALKIVCDVVERSRKMPTLIVVTGDLSESSDKKDFRTASRFFDFLIRGLNQVASTNLSRNEVIIVPGNHDINFKDNKSAYNRKKSRTGANDCPEKLAKFYEFYQAFYTNSRHKPEYDYEKGYQIFRFYERSFAVIGFDSCRKISYVHKKHPGWIYNKDINAAVKELNDEGQSPFRIAVFHHNPKVIPEFQDMTQVDFLQSASINVEAFWKGGIGIVFHGHRHINATTHLIESDDQNRGKFIAIGAGSLGSKMSNVENRYQLVDISLEKSQFKVNVYPRVFDLTPGAADRIGRGIFKADSACSRCFLDSPIPEISPAAAILASVSEEAGQAVSTISLPVQPPSNTKEMLIKLQQIYTLRVLHLYDDAKTEINNLLPNVTNIADKTILETIHADSDHQYSEENSLMSENDLRAARQALYNKLCSPVVQQASKSALLPPWVLRSELVRLRFLLAKGSAEYKAQFKELAMKEVNEYRDIFIESGNVDFMSLYRRIMLLLWLDEYSHAKQSLAEAMAIAPAFLPFYIVYANLAIYELRFDEALEHLEKAKSMVGRDLPAPGIDSLLLLCHYFLGNYEKALRIAEEGVSRWSNNAPFRNNYAFVRTRCMLRDLRSKFWDKPEVAASILDDFLKSILEIGLNGVAHFNYALLLYWAQNEGDDATFEMARKIIERYGRRDLVASPDIVTKAFQRAKNAFTQERDYFHATMAQYFVDRSSKQNQGGIKAKLLDELVWDADNFFSLRFDMDKCRRSLLSKNREIKGKLDIDHLTTLKRWMREGHPISIPKGNVRDGGGYFLKWKGKGVVINPGAGFINSFDRKGYAISEIDAILVTSSSYTAYEELAQLLNLVDQAYAYRPSEEKVEVYLEPRILHRFPDFHSRMVPSIITPQVITPGKSMSLFENKIEVKAFAACEECEKRPKFSMSTDRYPIQCILTIVELKEAHTSQCTIAIVCDCCSPRHLLDHLSKANIIITSVGPLPACSLFKDNMSDKLLADFMQLFMDDPLYKETFGLDREEEVKPDTVISKCLPVCNENALKPHVGIEGVFTIAENLKDPKKIIILGDIPFELGDKRQRLASTINQCFPKGPHFMTEDLGLVVGLSDLQVMCEFEHRMLPHRTIDEECLEGDFTGAVKHFCHEHRGDSNFGSFLARRY